MPRTGRSMAARLRLLAPALLACVLLTVLGASAAGSETDGAALRAVVGLSQLPVPDVSRFPLGSLPVPQPRIVGELPRLRLQRVDDEVLLDVAPFDVYGQPVPEAFEAISHAFRSRGGEEVTVHPRLVELLVTISAAFDGAPIRLVSGHRSPGRGTRKTSYHVKGMAADIAILGVKSNELRKAAIRLGAWGVGRYPAFVHVDVRSDHPYRWYGW